MRAKDLYLVIHTQIYPRLHFGALAPSGVRPPNDVSSARPTRRTGSQTDACHPLAHHCLDLCLDLCPVLPCRPRSMALSRSVLTYLSTYIGTTPTDMSTVRAPWFNCPILILFTPVPHISSLNFLLRILLQLYILLVPSFCSKKNSYSTPITSQQVYSNLVGCHTTRAYSANLIVNVHTHLSASGRVVDPS